MTPAEKKVAGFRDFVTKKLEAIASRMNGEPCITLVVRYEGEPECDVIVTNDTIDGIIAALERGRVRETS